MTPQHLVRRTSHFFAYRRAVLLGTVLGVVLGACSSGNATKTATPSTTQRVGDVGATRPAIATTPTTIANTTAAPTTAATTTPAGGPEPLPGMPAVVDPHNVYSETASGHMSPAVADAKSYVYVPSNDDGSVTVIDQAAMTVVDHYRVGKLVQHVVPAWDLSTLYASASGSNQLVPIDPATGKRGAGIRVDAPYNLYFTPDGTKAVVMAERKNRIDYYDPHTWKKLGSVAAPCRGVNHADWSADGGWFLVTCEFSGQLLKVDTATGAVAGSIDLGSGAMPQDVRLAPDGSKFYVADDPVLTTDRSQ